ncbi:MAG: glycine zipper domain-containing protein [Pseudomonadota bacterium]
MLKHWMRAGMALTLAASLYAAPASAHERHYRHHHHSSHHFRNCRTGGTVVGVATGAILGNAVTHHSTGGTIVGAAVGGYAGNRIANNNCRR